jgi:DnaK suppressor protein
VSKTPVQRTSASKPTASTPAPKAQAAAKTPAKAATTAKAAPKPAAKAAPAPKPAPAAAKAASPKAEPPRAKAAPRHADTQVAVATAFAHPVAGSASRFADRFAPPRPPTRPMNSPVIDVTKTPHKADPKLVNAWKSKAGSELTEAEVLAMPDSEYMNDKQVEFFRTRLQALKDDLLSNAGETTEHLREDTSIVPDPADRATIEEEHALELRTRDRERKLLKKIAQSLGRLDSGDYGFCDETGEPIGLGRLIARPTATLSLEAQQRRELKQKMFGD